MASLADVQMAYNTALAASGGLYARPCRARMTYRWRRSGGAPVTLAVLGFGSPRDVRRQSLVERSPFGLSGGCLLSEMVELMLDGIVCEECGVVLGEPVGHPRRCAACERSQQQDEYAEEREVEGEEDTLFR